MPQLKPKELRNQGADKLRQTLFDLRSELSKLSGEAQRGIVKKDVGNIRRIRKDIARVITVMHEKGVAE
ncbi:MAG: 50S ribosomal protein L29 [Nitrososphaerota archaeon]|jgi:ribosomal protein L29|nr:50S ribosomal protein L29 [Nitrososphaerota archaeon]MDG6942162.1 50S ribosomal protein L29 [Nitrososphaerota archaeon]MDG6942627.1 50S ribosomal protein L29 [Nitrososphaerota archaeon]MDG6948414.1 50S ribosomal protein L29 [Nitrososphaerota archaeon]MDG6950340.1 50S ribosomal protein L29 [Nitrososphaerota archaeon]